MSEYVDLAALLKVAAVSLTFGAGLVAVFSLGIANVGRVATSREDGTTDGPAASAATLLFALFATAIAFGLYVMLSK